MVESGSKNDAANRLAITTETNIATSVVRRCQNCVSVIGCKLFGPLFIAGIIMANSCQMSNQITIVFGGHGSMIEAIANQRRDKNVSIVERAFNSVFPTAEELWELGGATYEDDIPFFDLEIDGQPVEYATRDLHVKDRFKRKRIGRSTLLGYHLSDGTDRLVSVRTLDDEHRSDADFITTTSTAWTTTVGGYAGRRDERIARNIGVQTVTIGAEGSTNERLLKPGVLGAISLAKAAQSEQLILADVSERFDLSNRHYAIGDSRGAMIKPGHSLYAPMYGNEVLFTDIKAPCVPDRLQLEDLPKVALWATVEAMGAIGVASSLAKDHDLGLLAGTFDFHPRAVPTALAGVMPALMSGEAGRLAELAPDDMQGHVVLYGHDILSSVHRWHEIYSSKPGMKLKDVPRGSHAHLLNRIQLQLDRVTRAEEFVRLGFQLDHQSVAGPVNKANQKQADLRLVV